VRILRRGITPKRREDRDQARHRAEHHRAAGDADDHLENEDAASMRTISCRARVCTASMFSDFGQ